MHVYCFLSLLQPCLALNFLCSWDDLGLLTLLPAPYSHLHFRDGRHVPSFPTVANIFMYFLLLFEWFFKFNFVLLHAFGYARGRRSVTTLCYRSMLDDTL